MRRPELPAFWRVALALAALLMATLVAMDAAPSAAQRSLQAVYPLLFLGGAILGGAVLISVARRAALAAGGGVMLAVLMGFATSSPFTSLAGLGFLGPVAILLARPNPIATPVALVGSAMFLHAQALMLRQRGPAPVDGALHTYLLAGAGLLAAAYLGTALAARTAAHAPSTARRGNLVLVAAGALLLAVSYAIGGNLIFVPLWPFALALLVLPALIRRRAQTTAAALLGGILLVGLFPVATCTIDPYSDAMVPGVPAHADAYPEPVSLLQLGTHGPNWRSGGGFAGETVRCPGWALALGAAWGVALVAAAWRAVRPSRTLKTE